LEALVSDLSEVAGGEIGFFALLEGLELFEGGDQLGVV
jgi:hypothetical protein